ECVRTEGISCEKSSNFIRKVVGWHESHSIGEVNDDEVVSPYEIEGRKMVRALTDFNLVRISPMSLSSWIRFVTTQGCHRRRIARRSASSMPRCRRRSPLA
ncbi:hypothetical protein Dimus_035671, partial [Dionaea muscipula]